MIAAAVVAAIAMLGASVPAFAASPYEYDRQGLVDLMHQYLAALVKHDPKAVPFAEEVKFVENTSNIPVGLGLWQTATRGPSDFQIYAADPVTQQVAALVMMQETGATPQAPAKDILVGFRLKTEDRKITEAEHLVIRDMSGPMAQAGLANLKTPRPAFLEDISPEERTPRAEMLHAGRAYYTALDDNDGKLAPFSPDCERHEYGMITASPKKQPPPPGMPAIEAPHECEAQISSGAFTYISHIRNRRVVIADEQKGITVGFSMFYHDSTVKEYKTKGPDGKEITVPSWQGTFNLPAMHICKIRKGKLVEIEAIGYTTAYGTKSGWE
jgi:hypothetical protein